MQQTGIFDLTARRHESAVLASFLDSRPGARKRAGVDQVANLTAVSSNVDAMSALFQPLKTSSGFAVTDSTALCVSTVYACLTRLAGAIMQLPLHTYTLNAKNEPQASPPVGDLWRLLNQQPSKSWTAASWKEWIVRCWGLRGDQLTQIIRDRRPGREADVAGLLPLHPDYVQTVALPNGELRYNVQDRFNGRVYGLEPADVLHFAGFGFDGVRSQSVVQWAARNSIGNALAASDYMGRTIGGGAMPKIAITYKNRMGTDQAKLLRDSFVATYTGPQSHTIPLVLTEGGEVKELSISPLDMQLIESRRFEKEDICQAFGVPPVMIGENEKTSSWGTGVEQITLGFVKFTLAPMVRRWEEELSRKLFPRGDQWVEFSMDALLRGDSKAQAEAFRAALGGPGTGDGWLSVDEVRKLTNQPALGGNFATPYTAQRGAGPTTGATKQ